ncbi:MAG TPA: hypothetical protein VF597_04665 [Candidatus Saccharimonadales bacterium]|jgi:hypothetical protein
MTDAPLDFPAAMGAVAVSALVANGIVSLKHATVFTESELLLIHGVGPKAVRVLKDELAKHGLSLR